MSFRSYDLMLGALPLLLAETKGKQSIEFGLTTKEPGPRAEIGSIEMTSFHHGPGQEIAFDPRAVKTAENIDISVPGRVYPGGNFEYLFTAAAGDDYYWDQGGGSIVVPKQGNPNSALKIYFITAKRIYSIETDTDTPAAVYTNPSTLAFTGQVARYRDKLFFPRETEAREAAAPIIIALASETAYEASGIVMSRCYSSGNCIWWIVNHGYMTPPEIYWTDDDDFPGEPVCVTVKWTGNGTSQNVTGCPWQPDVVIAKGNTGQEAVLKTNTMGATESRLWITAGQITTGITSFLSNGFSVGSHDAVNKSGVEYVAACFKKRAGFIDTLTYDGNAVDNRDITCTFSPDLALVAKGAVGTVYGQVAIRPKTLTGDNTFFLTIGSPIADAIQSLGENKFQVGLNQTVNENAIPYHAVIFKESPGILKLATYVGDGTDARVTDVTLPPAYAIIKCATVWSACQRMGVKTGDWSAPFAGGIFGSDQIEAFGATTLTVGTAGQVNQNAQTYHYMAFGPTTDYLRAGPFALDAGGYCSWLHVIGPYTLPFKADGMVYGTDEYGSPAPFLSHDEGGGMDLSFGHGAKMDWRGRLLIPTRDSLKALHFPSLESEDVNPMVQLAGSDTAYRRVSSINAIGSRLAVVLEKASACTLFLSQEYPDGEFLTPASGYTGFSTGIAPIHLADGSYAFYWLQRSLSGYAQIAKLYVAAVDHIVGPQQKTTFGYLVTSKYAGEGLAAAVTKRFIQLRGYAVAANGTNPTTIKATLDTGSALTLGTVTAPGPFSLPFPKTTAALGRFLAALIDKLGDGELALPLIADFEYVPAAEDIVTFGIDVSDVAVNRLGGVWKRKAAHDIHAALVAMRGTFTTLKWGEGRADWTVFVEDVTSQNLIRRSFQQAEEDVVFVVCRRVG